MNTLFFVLSFTLLILGLVGVVRGRVDQRWIRSRTASLIPLAFGFVFLFSATAPPLNAAGSVGKSIPPPATAASILDTIEPIIRRGTAPIPDLQPEQQKAFPQWERQVLESHKKADEILKQVSSILTALDDGLIDRFTAWTHLSILAEDLKQAKLSLHHLTPPTVLNLADQKTLESALNDLRQSLRGKRNGIRALQEFVRSSKRADLDRAQYEMEKGHDTMVSGLGKVARVKARLDVS